MILTHTYKQTIYVKIMARPESPYFSKKRKKKKEKRPDFYNRFVPACSQNREGFLHFCTFILSAQNFPCGWFSSLASQNCKKIN